MLHILFTVIVSTNAEDFGKSLTTTKSAHMGHSSLWLPRSFRITCCLGGFPVPENPQMIRNWTHEESDYIIDERYGESSSSGKDLNTESNCRVFHGNYLLAASTLFTFDDFNGFGVICKCPETKDNEILDRNCRHLKACLNDGYRSFSSSSHCICPEPYFGDQCEKYCDQGQRMKGTDGRDYCGCVPFYQGEECRNMMCLNGGTELNRRCRCPPNFIGYHCEIDANRSSAVSRFHGYGEQGIYQESDLFTRDVSGTIFSLIMIVVLVLSMYLLMKHRMQMQNRFSTMRRDAMIRTTVGLGVRRGNMIIPEDPRMLHFRAIPLPDDGPPPYAINAQRGRSRRSDQLPPLPTYEDATKLAPVTRPNTIVLDDGARSPSEFPDDGTLTISEIEDDSGSQQQLQTHSMISGSPLGNAAQNFASERTEESTISSDANNELIENTRSSRNSI